MDARSRDQVLSVIAHVRGCLGDTSGAVASARKKFDEGWGYGLVHWDKVGEKLAPHRTTRSLLQPLRRLTLRLLRPSLRAKGLRVRHFHGATSSDRT